MPFHTIPKLRPQWKILHEFKPRGYVINHTPPVSLRVDAKEHRIFEIDFPPRWGLWATNSVQMRLVLWGETRNYEVAVCRAPGKWSRIEISHERDDEGNHTLAMAVGGQEVGRVGVDHQNLSNLTDVKICFGSNPDVGGHLLDYQDGSFRGLVVLDKL